MLLLGKFLGICLNDKLIVINREKLNGDIRDRKINVEIINKK